MEKCLFLMNGMNHWVCQNAITLALAILDNYFSLIRPVLRLPRNCCLRVCLQQIERVRGRECACERERERFARMCILVQFYAQCMLSKFDDDLQKKWGCKDLFIFGKFNKN